MRSDKVILTSDNPRDEDPDEILREMEAGVPAGLIRMSCGLEDKEDLIADLRQALEAID